MIVMAHLVTLAWIRLKNCQSPVLVRMGDIACASDSIGALLSWPDHSSSFTKGENKHLPGRRLILLSQNLEK